MHGNRLKEESFDTQGFRMTSAFPTSFSSVIHSSGFSREHDKPRQWNRSAWRAARWQRSNAVSPIWFRSQTWVCEWKRSNWRVSGVSLWLALKWSGVWPPFVRAFASAPARSKISTMAALFQMQHCARASIHPHLQQKEMPRKVATAGKETICEVMISEISRKRLELRYAWEAIPLRADEHSLYSICLYMKQKFHPN